MHLILHILKITLEKFTRRNVLEEKPKPTIANPNRKIIILFKKLTYKLKKNVYKIILFCSLKIVKLFCK